MAQVETTFQAIHDILFNLFSFSQFVQINEWYITFFVI